MIEDEDGKLSLLVTSLPFQNELDHVYNEAGPWTLKVANVSLYRNLLNILLKSNISCIYFLVSNKWKAALESKVKNYSKSINLNTEIIFVALDRNIWNLGDALRFFQSKYVLQKAFILLTLPTMFQFSLDKVTEVFKKSNENTILISFNFRSSSENCWMVLKDSKIIKISPFGEDFKFDLKMMGLNRRLQLVQKYQFPSLYVCRPNILSFFEDNFDCVSMDTLINWVSSNQEILNFDILCHESESYILSVSNPDQYFSLNKDFFNGWFNSGHENMKNNNLSNESKLLSGSFTDKSSKIGSGCVFKSSFVYKNASVGENSILKNCIISKGASVGKNCLLRNIIVPPSKSLNSNFKEKFPSITVIPTTESSFDASETINHGTGTFQLSDVSDLDAINCSLNANDYDFKFDKCDEFKKEVIKTLKKSLEADNLSNANIDIQLVRNDFSFEPELFHRMVIACLCESLTVLFELNMQTQDKKTALINSINKFECVFKFYIADTNSEINALDTIASFSAQNENFLSFLNMLLYEFYSRDILSEDAVLSWFEGLDDDDYPNTQKCISSFIDFLKNSE